MFHADCHGIYDIIEAIDGLYSQANKGTLANCFGVETQFVTQDGVRSFADCTDGERVVVRGHSGAWRSVFGQ